MADEYKYLLPQPDADSEPFWAAAKKHELRFQQCASCQVFRHPPRRHCANCGSEDSEWVQVSGKGTIYSYIGVVQPVLPQWREDAPYNIVEVAPDNAPGVVIMGNVAGVDDSELKVGMPVEVTFDDVTGDVTIPRWTTA